MILIDAGPLVALIDRGEPDHARCVAMLRTVSAPLLTTWPAFTEAMYLLGEAGGWRGQAALWAMVAGGHLEIREASPQILARMPALMEKYRDTPMDLADASLVALAEEQRLDTVFTLDSDFRVYRLPRGRVFTLIP